MVVCTQAILSFNTNSISEIQYFGLCPVVLLILLTIHQTH